MKISLETIIKYNPKSNILNYWLENNLKDLDFPYGCDISITHWGEATTFMWLLENIRGLNIKTIKSEGLLFNFKYNNKGLLDKINVNGDDSVDNYYNFYYNDSGLLIKKEEYYIYSDNYEDNDICYYNYVYNDKNLLIEINKTVDSVCSQIILNEYNSDGLLIKMTLGDFKVIVEYDYLNNLLIKANVKHMDSKIPNKTYSYSYVYNSKNELINVEHNGVIPNRATIRIKDDKFKGIYVLPFLKFR